MVLDQEAQLPKKASNEEKVRGLSIFTEIKWLSNLISKQESPTAWTQEAYRPPCSCSVWWVGGTPGTPPPSRPGQGVHSLGSTPSQVWGGTPARSGVGTPSQVWGVPRPGLDGGYPIPEVGVPWPGLDGGGWGTPHHSDLDGIPPDLRWGTPNHPDLDGVRPPPPRKCEQTENITFPHPSDAGGKNTQQWRRMWQQVWRHMWQQVWCHMWQQVWCHMWQQVWRHLATWV